MLTIFFPETLGHRQFFWLSRGRANSYSSVQSILASKTANSSGEFDMVELAALHPKKGNLNTMN
jgi:hypothetical protein